MWPMESMTERGIHATGARRGMLQSRYQFA
jgi:hypothetical protein